MKPIFLTVVLLAIITGLALASPDVVKTRDGRVLQGTVSVAGDILTCESDSGIVQLPLTDVLYFEHCGDKEASLQSKIAEADFSKLKEVLGLADWAKSNSVAQTKIRRLYEKAIELDQNGAEAHLALGHVKYDGAWMGHDMYMASTGHVQENGQWVPMHRSATDKAQIMHAQQAADLQDRVNKCFAMLMDRDQTRVSEAFEAITEINEELPGILEKAREVKQFASDQLNSDTVMFDGQSAVLELRISNAMINWDHGLEVTLTGDPPGPAPGLTVFLPLPRQQVTTIKTTVIVPGGGRGGGF